MEGVPVRVVTAVRDGPDQSDGLVEGSDVTRLLGLDDQVGRLLQRVAPRVVPGLVGEPGPQLTRHPPVIDQVEQAEHTDGGLEVPGGEGTVPVRQGAGPVERGNGVKDIGVGLFGSPADRGEEIRRESQGIVLQHALRISTVAELPYAGGQLTEARVLHESPRPSEHSS